jgi:hypothetical protein
VPIKSSAGHNNSYTGSSTSHADSLAARVVSLI